MHVSSTQTKTTKGRPVLLPAALVQQLKILAAQDGTTIRELTEAAITAYLAKKEKEKKALTPQAG